ncbi:gag-pol polyprotein [Tanacetum coccineum]
MSTSNTHQQSFADAGSETRLPMLERGSYIPWASRFRRMKDAKKEDLKGDDLKHYEAKIVAMNLILISIPNDIYNSVDACTTAQAMWQRVERLMRRTVQNKVDRETRFNNEFDQFIAKPGEALVSVYNHFAQLMNDLERNGIIFPKVTVNTKFLNCLQPEWLKYVTQVCLAKRLTEDTYDDLFNYLQQFEKLVNASRAKKLEKSHDPLALVAHTVQNNSEYPLTCAMILLARAITQRFSNLTNNHLYTSSNTRNQAIVQGDRNDAGNIQRTLQTTSSRTAAYVQCYNCSEKGHYARNCPKPRNDFLFADASRMEEIKELSANICLMARIQPANLDSDAGPSYDSAFLSEKLARNAFKEAEKQQIIAKKVQQQNTVLTKQLESYKEKESQSQFIHDRDIIRDLEQQRDKLELYVVELKRQTVELQNTQSILKHKMSENEDKYHDTVLDLEARAKKNADVVLKIGNSLQGMFMLGPKPMSFYDSNSKHGLGYANPYTLKKAISQNLKLYDASCFDDLKIHVNIRDIEDILDDATKNQIKMKNK